MIAILILALFTIAIVAIYSVTHSQAWYGYWKKKGRERTGLWWDWRYSTGRRA